MIHEYDGVIAIDTQMHGRAGITAVYYLPGETSTIIETGPATSLEVTLQGLAEAGAREIDLIVVTHIHLDHAGAVGHLARQFEKAKVVVRVEGAPHLVDPSRLWASAGRLYPNMEELWGEILPVPEDRLIVVARDGLVADLGDGRRLEAIYAPGHASHQMALLDRKRGDLYTGDAIGVWSPEARVIRPATPPPDFNLEISIETVERLRALRPSRVFPTHFGPVADPDQAFDEAISRFREWVQAAELAVADGADLEGVAEVFREKTRDWYPGIPAQVADKLENTTSYRLNAAGILRYLSKKAEQPS